MGARNFTGDRHIVSTVIWVVHWNRLKKTLCIGMPSVAFKSTRGQVLNDRTAVHDINAVAKVFDDLHIMRDEKNG